MLPVWPNFQFHPNYFRIVCAIYQANPKWVYDWSTYLYFHGLKSFIRSTNIRTLPFCQLFPVKLEWSDLMCLILIQIPDLCKPIWMQWIFFQNTIYKADIIIYLHNLYFLEIEFALLFYVCLKTLWKKVDITQLTMNNFANFCSKGIWDKPQF